MTEIRIKHSRFIAAVLLLAAVSVSAAQTDAFAPPNAAQVVEHYIASLLTGDTQALSNLIAGPMRDKNRQLSVKPQNYSQFLKQYYAGVQTTVVGLEPFGSGVKARVRFDYPSQDSAEVILVLSQIEGQWRVIDEVY